MTSNRVVNLGITASILANWALAAWLWPGLPERIPIHFDAAGNPDGWAEASWYVVFALPALATLVGGMIGFVLPRLMVAMAKKNSPWLNVPNKKAFAALPEDARVRAIAAPSRWLAVLAIAVQFLFGWITFGSARVAAGEWTRLPPWPSFALIGAVMVCAAALAISGSRAVGRELAR